MKRTEGALQLGHAFALCIGIRTQPHESRIALGSLCGQLRFQLRCPRLGRAHARAQLRKRCLVCRLNGLDTMLCKTWSAPMLMSSFRSTPRLMLPDVETAQ